MSDPLSAAASTVAFVTAALSIAQSTCKLIDDIKNAGLEVDSLASQMTEFTEVLGKLQQLADFITTSPDETIRRAGFSPEFVKDCSLELENVQLIVMTINTKLSNGKTRRFFTKMKWSLKDKNQVALCASRIEGRTNCLLLGLGVLQSTCALRTDDRLQQVDSLLQATASQTSGSLLTIQETLQKSTSDSLVMQQSLTKIDDKLKTLRMLEAPIRQHRLDTPCHVNLDPRNYRFYGRNAALERMTQELVPPNKPDRLRSFALSGMAGVGKSQTALEFVHKHLDRFKAVLWVSADGRQKLVQGFVEIARALGLFDIAVVEDHAKSIASVKRWCMTTDEPWVLIFDNADELDVINDFWPTAAKGSVVITSQNPASDRHLATQGVHLTPFAPVDGVRCLEHLLGDKSTTDEYVKLAQISEALGYLPLALDQMASFILETDCTIASFQRMYSDRELADELQGTTVANTHGYSKTVAAALALSLERLGDIAGSTMNILAFFDPDQVPEELLKDTAGYISYLSKPIVREKVFKDLRSFSLITRNPEKKTVTIHRLVRDASFRSLEVNTDKMQLAFENALYLLCQVFPKQSPSRDHMTEMWTDCETYASHVISLHERYIQIAQKLPVQPLKGFAELLYHCSWYSFERGRFDLSFPLARTAEKLCQAMDSNDSRLLLADAYSVQAAMLNEQTEMKAAITLWDKALEIREKLVAANVLDADHPNRANSFMNLGVSVAHHDTMRAIQLHQKALEIRRRSTKFANIQVQGLSLNHMNIGRSWLEIGELDKAAAAFEDCIAIIKPKEEETGLRFGLTAWALWSKGNVEIQRGNLDEAFVLHTQSMELHGAILGPSHRKTAACYYKIAWFLHKRGDYDRAIELLQRTLDIYLEKDDADSKAQIARTKYKLGAVLKDAKKLEEARKMRRDAQILRQQLTGRGLDEDDKEEEYDKMIAYFYR